MNKTSIHCLTLVLVLGGCSSYPERVPDSHCQSEAILLDAHFDGGNLGHCEVIADRVFDLTLFPEDEPPINPSPWYAFRVSGQAGDQVDITLSFENGYARYWPRISTDGETWSKAPAPRVEINKEGDRMKLALELPQALLWVAGQEILNGAYYDQWLTELDSHDEVETRLLGQSIEGRPIYLASTAPQPEFVLLMGRQHPPEVTGAIAMQSFVRTVLGPSELALQFRNRFQLAIVPLVNPDGVAAGHWRHNAGGVDSNRDWGPFTQPETRAVIHWIENREAQGGQLQLSVDFHSTHEDLIYTQPTTENPVDFSSRWLNASALRLPHFPFKHSADPVSEQANSKNYFHTSRGIPAVTFESGDQTSRDQLKAAAVVFAEEMMRALLELPRG